MSDARLRALEQRYIETGDPADLSALLACRRRLGLGLPASPRLELAARCGSVAAAQALDLPRLPLGPGCPRSLAAALRRERQRHARPARYAIAAHHLRLLRWEAPWEEPRREALAALAQAGGWTHRERARIAAHLQGRLPAAGYGLPVRTILAQLPWLLGRSNRQASEALAGVFRSLAHLEGARPDPAVRARVFTRSLEALEAWAFAAPAAAVR